MRNASIVGWGHTPFGRLDGQDLESLVLAASREAIASAGIAPADIDAVFLGHFNSGMVPDGFCASLPLSLDPGLRFKPAARLENACASGSAAIHAGLAAIESGRARAVLVVGAEKMTAVDNAAVTRALAGTSYWREEGAEGQNFPRIFAQFARLYFERYGNQSDTLARIAVKNHANGARNPLAHMRRALDFEFCRTVSERNPLIADPLRKTDCSTVADGAAALVLVRDDMARQFPQAIGFRAASHVNDLLPMSQRDLLTFEGPRRAWAAAYEEAGIGVNDLSFVEVHDCFTIAELLSYEAMGLAAPGRGREVVEDGTVAVGGRLPVNPSAGLKAKGHPDEILTLARTLREVSMFAAPTMVKRLVERAVAAGSDGDGIKAVVYGGGPMYTADIQEALRVMGPRFVQIYGQGECPMAITALSRALLADGAHPRHAERIASVGIAQSNVELRIAAPDGSPMPAGEAGDILVRGDSVMPGYWRNPEASREALRDGWLHTGDVGQLDADSFLTLKDRSKDVIISGGSNIYPREVEEVLLCHPAVREVAVIGRPHPEWGEEVLAFVVPHAGAALDTAELDALCMQRIARFKRPRRYRPVDELPKNNYGKVLKTALRALDARNGSRGRRRLSPRAIARSRELSIRTTQGESTWSGKSAASSRDMTHRTVPPSSWTGWLPTSRKWSRCPA